jgi:hypothetical protein
MRAALSLSFLIVLFLLGTLTGCESCGREPAIVIRFEPVDAAGAATSKAADLAKATVADLASAPAPAAKSTACSKDADCVLEMEDCCGCTATGKQHAVHKLDKETEAAHSKRCRDTMCGQAMSTDPSCRKKAACVKGVCALK